MCTSTALTFHLATQLHDLPLQLTSIQSNLHSALSLLFSVSVWNTVGRHIMSDDEIVVGVPLKEEEGAPELPREERPKYKSWRKKYRKMKVHFDERLKFNNRLYKEEQKLEALARRIRESNE